MSFSLITFQIYVWLYPFKLKSDVSHIFLIFKSLWKSIVFW